MQQGRRDWGPLAVAALVVALRAPWLLLGAGWDNAEILEFGGITSHAPAFVAWLSDYRGQPNEGGAIWFGLASLPVRLLLGPSVLCLRVTALLWHGATAGVLAACVPKPARWWLAAAYALAPPAIAQLGVQGWAVHLEAVLPLVLAWAALRGKRWLLVGALLVLSVDFQLSAAAVGLGLGVLALRRSGRGQRLRLLAGGGLGALLAWVLGDWGALLGFAASAAGEGGAALPRLWQLLWVNAPAAAGFASDVQFLGGTPGGLVWGRWWLAPLLVAALLGARTGPGRLALGLALLHVGAALLSGRELTEARHLAPAWPWLLVAGACAPRTRWLLALPCLLALLHSGVELTRAAERPGALAALRWERHLPALELRHHAGLAARARERGEGPAFQRLPSCQRGWARGQASWTAGRRSDDPAVQAAWGEFEGGEALRLGAALPSGSPAYDRGVGFAAGVAAINGQLVPALTARQCEGVGVAALAHRSAPPTGCPPEPVARGFADALARCSLGSPPEPDPRWVFDHWGPPERDAFSAAWCAARAP